MSTPLYFFVGVMMDEAIEATLETLRNHTGLRLSARSPKLHCELEGMMNKNDLKQRALVFCYRHGSLPVNNPKVLHELTELLAEVDARARVEESQQAATVTCDWCEGKYLDCLHTELVVRRELDAPRNAELAAFRKVAEAARAVNTLWHGTTPANGIVFDRRMDDLDEALCDLDALPKEASDAG